MYGSRSFIIFWNCAMSSDCAPSLMAFSGAGCTSTINPSAPIATPARESAGTRLRFPVAWLGSRTTGRCVNSFSAGIAAMSHVLRVTVSNVRIPRSHKITSAFPCAVTYSADIKSSFTVLLNPRFSSTGRPHFPNSFSSMKFCMFRAPTCITSAYFATKSTSRSLITSVIIARAAAQHFCARFRHAFRRLHDLFLRFDRARPGHHHEFRAADLRSIYFYFGFARAKLLAHEFVRRRNPHHVVHLRHGFDRFHARRYIPYPNDADHHALFSFDGMHLVSEVLHLFAYFIDLLPRCVQFHGDDHLSGPLNLFLSPKTKKPTRLASGSKLFSVYSLTETPPAAWMDSK